MASPADVNLICCNGAGEVETDITGTGIDYISADNATNSIGNRTANPITIPTSGFAYSYEKWLKFELGTTEPDTQVTNFKFWGTGAVIDSGNVKDYYKVTNTYATPAEATTTTGYTAVTAATSATKASISGTLNSQGDATQYMVMMLEVGTAAAQGNMAQQTYNYSYDEN
jgi:hypothetical protein